jgi:glycosyltransferase involved in cell wall biosynthesis
VRQSGQLRVLLVSVGDQLLTNPRSGIAARLATYADRVDRLTQVVYSPRRHGCRPTGWSARFASYPTRSPSRATFPLDALALGSHLLRGAPVDLIETQDPVAAGLVGLALGRRFGAPVVVGCHTEFFASRAWARESLRNRAEQAIARLVVRRAQGVRAVSSAVAESVAALRVPRERIGIAPIPLDRALFERGRDQTPARRRAGDAEPRTARLLFVGRLVPSKDLPTLLRALARLRAGGLTARLDVAGGGPDLARCQAEAARLGLLDLVRFRGDLPPAALSDLYWGSDLLILPTLYEGYGRVLAEAAVHGLPSVATPVGGVADLLTDGQTGRLVPPGDPEALAGALAALLPDRDRLESLGRTAWQQAIARFDPDRQADDLVAFWRRIAGSPAGR